MGTWGHVPTIFWNKALRMSHFLILTPPSLRQNFLCPKYLQIRSGATVSHNANRGPQKNLTRGKGFSFGFYSSHSWWCGHLWNVFGSYVSASKLPLHTYWYQGKNKELLNQVPTFAGALEHMGQGRRSLRGRGSDRPPSFLWILSVLPSKTWFARSISRFRPPRFSMFKVSPPQFFRASYASVKDLILLVL